MNEDYIQGLRKYIGHAPLILVFAGGVLVNATGEVLLQQRSDSHRWGFPGGLLHYGETTSHAAIREFREETGLETTVLRLLGTTSNQITHYPNGDIAQAVGVIFEMQQTSGQLTDNNDETVALQWFALDRQPDFFNTQAKNIWRNLQTKTFPFYD